MSSTLSSISDVSIDGLPSIEENIILLANLTLLGNSTILFETGEYPYLLNYYNWLFWYSEILRIFKW